MAEPIPFQTAFHADWSTAAKKCWVAKAERTDEGWYVRAPHPVGNIGAFVDGLFVHAGPVLAGFDFPIGLPDAYGRLTGLKEFPAALDIFGLAEWAKFYVVAETPEQVTVRRPFYPRTSSRGHRRSALVRGLRVQCFKELLRQCERATPMRGAACSLFWTLGGNQVGRAAISGWQEVVAPARRRGAKLWPFEGSLAELARAGYPVIAATYPAEAYSHVGIRFPRNGSKRRQEDRAFATKGIFEWARRNQVIFSEELAAQINTGFGARNNGEDQFDAFVGVLGIIEVLEGRRDEGSDAGNARLWEGWIIGQTE